MLAWCITLAGAAEVTWMPDALDGAASVAYAGRIERGGLIEGDQRIAERRVQEHRIDALLQFAPVRGAALTLGIAHVPGWSYTYPDARQMLIEPVDGGGSYLNGPVTGGDPPSVRGGGREGFWLGVALSPFSEAYEQGQRFTWRLDAGVRTANRDDNRWSVSDGTRGGGPGGTATRLVGAFSTRQGAADSYLRAAWQREGRVTLDIVDEQGRTRANGLEVRPASHLDLRGGTEVTASAKGESRTAIDLHVGFGYRTWEDIPTGLLLPDPIAAAHSIPVTHAESVYGNAGMGLLIVFNRNLRASAGGRFEYTLPHTQEHVFDVKTTPDTFGIGWWFSLTGVLGKTDLVGD